MSKAHQIEKVITTDLPVNEIWNSLLTPDPFPGNLFIDNETTYVCYPLGTGRIGGYRFEYGNHKWLIIRLTSADLNSMRIRWDLVDIKSSALKSLMVSIALESDEGLTKVNLVLNYELSFWANLFTFIVSRKLHRKLNSFGIAKEMGPILPQR